MLRPAARSWCFLQGFPELHICCCRPGLAEDTQTTSSLLQSVQSTSCRCYVSPMQSFPKGEAGINRLPCQQALCRHRGLLAAAHCCLGHWQWPGTLVPPPPGHSSQFVVHPCPHVQLARVLSLMSCGRDSLCSQRLSVHGSPQQARLLGWMEHPACIKHQLHANKMEQSVDGDAAFAGWIPD